MSEPRVTTRRGLFEILRGKPPERGHWVKVHRPAMACRFEVTLDAEDARHVEAARAALDEVDAIEAALTWFRDTSELVARQPRRGRWTRGRRARSCSRSSRSAASSTPRPAAPSIPRARALSRCWGFLDRAAAAAARGRARRGPGLLGHGQGRARRGRRAACASRRPASS